ncbi:MAG: double-cubane-cluster-containing anaerobic reductase [Lagierella massiliensis]|nr:double-cubane-cluster-containing anaerobic reductase [Lagierella massiliensis]
MSLSLPQRFEELSEARKDGFIKVKDLKEAGKKIAGVFCAYTPCEILDAAGLVSVGLCGTSQETIPIAENTLPKNLCPLIKSSYGFAVSEKCPYTYFSDLIIGETTCDGKKKMYELLRDLGKDVYVMHLPQGNKRSYASKVWKEEIKLLKEYIEEKFEIEITDEMIRKSVKKSNRLRKAKHRMFELQKMTPPPMYGIDMVKATEGEGYKLTLQDRIDAVEELCNSIEENFNKNGSEVCKNAKRIMLTGCPMGGVMDKVCKTIEDNGGVIVVYDTCSGTRTCEDLIDEDADDILLAIAERYLKIGCSVMADNTERVENIQRLIEEYKVDGVVEVVLQACHTFNVEAVKIEKEVRKAKIPYTKIELDYSDTDRGQVSTRLEAFLEMIEK